MKFPFTIIAILALSLSACVHAPIQQPPMASHIALDQSVNDAKASQQKAASQVKVIVQRINDPADKQLVIDLQSTISELGFKLDTVTGRVQWYEGEYGTLWQHDSEQTHLAADRAETIKKQAVSISWWRKWALIGWGIITAAILGVVIYFAGPWLGKILGAVIKTP